MTGEMIKRVNIRGYKSLKEINNVELRPLNILIGPNNGGKTNFIDFFRLLSECAEGRLEEGFVNRGGFDSIIYANSTDRKIAWETYFLNIDETDSQLSYKVELTKRGYSPIVEKEELFKRLTGEEEMSLITSSSGKVSLRRSGPDIPSVFEDLQGRIDERMRVAQLKNDQLIIAQISDPFVYPAVFRLSSYLKSWGFYSEFPTGLDSPLRRAQSLRPGLCVSPSGDNLFSVLNNLRERHEYREYYNEILKTLRVLFPTLGDFHFPPVAGEGKIALAWEGGEFKREFPSYILSDGLLKFLCLTTLLLSPELPPLICIDEPEIGLHPRSMGLIGELLTAAANRTQLIVATHSPQLIKQLKPEDILTVEKKDGATELRRLPPEELGSWLKDFTLDELWLTGVIGGR